MTGAANGNRLWLMVANDRAISRGVFFGWRRRGVFAGLGVVFASVSGCAVGADMAGDVWAGADAMMRADNIRRMMEPCIALALSEFTPWWYRGKPLTCVLQVGITGHVDLMIGGRSYTLVYCHEIQERNWVDRVPARVEYAIRKHMPKPQTRYLPISQIKNPRGRSLTSVGVRR